MSVCAALFFLLLQLPATGAPGGATQGLEDERPVVEETILVTATRTPQAAADILADHTLISSEEIVRSGATNILDLLQKQRGIEVVRNGGPGTASSVLIRGADAKQSVVLVDGIRIAREIAKTEPLAHWLKREVAPGPDVTGDEELGEYARKVAHTVYHPAGTCRMGAVNDEQAVVDPELKVRGLEGIRIADASVFPAMTAVNPMIGVLMVGERAVDLIGGGA